MSISLANFMGRARETSSAVDITISAGTARVWTIEMTAASKKVKLEDPVDWFPSEGWPWFFVFNVGATHDFDLCKSDGTVIVAVPVGECAIVGLADADLETWQTLVR